jgi:tetratricopeptide (TPR) repeat protein
MNSLPSVDNLEKSQFLSQNQQQLTKLLSFIDFAEGFTLGFIEVNSDRELDWVIDYLKHKNLENYQLLVLSFPEPDLRFLLDDICQKLTQENLKKDKKPIIFIKDLEQSIGSYRKYPPILQDLNFVRDLYPHHLPYPLLFCLPSYAITRLAKFAPDFWAWKSEIFRFQSIIQPKDHLSPIPDLLNYQLHRLYKTPETESRIQLLNNFFQEYSQSHKPQDLPTFLTILNQLGIAYYKQGELGKAEHYLREALDLIQDNPSLDSAKGDILYDLGNAYGSQGQYQEAIASYEQALAIRRDIGDRRGEADCLTNLGVAYGSQGQYQEADLSSR